MSSVPCRRSLLCLRILPIASYGEKDSARSPERQALAFFCAVDHLHTLLKRDVHIPALTGYAIHQPDRAFRMRHGFTGCASANLQKSSFVNTDCKPFAVTEDLSGPLNVSDGCVLTFVTLARDSISPRPASVFLKTGLLGKSSIL